MAALASQTLLKTLGVACWDAFVAGGTASSSIYQVASSSSMGGERLCDADKVRKMLEGKAVVDVDERDTRIGGVGCHFHSCFPPLIACLVVIPLSLSECMFPLPLLLDRGYLQITYTVKIILVSLFRGRHARARCSTMGGWRWLCRPTP